MVSWVSTSNSLLCLTSTKKLKSYRQSAPMMILWVSGIIYAQQKVRCMGGVLPPLPVIECTFGLCWAPWYIQWLRRDLAKKCLFHIQNFMCSNVTNVLLSLLEFTDAILHSGAMPQPTPTTLLTIYSTVTSIFINLLKLKYSNMNRTNYIFTIDC